MKVAIITEGYHGTGYGHLTRCLSIYQAFEEKGITPLYIANCDEVGKKYIHDVNLLQMNWLDKSDELINTLIDFDIAVIDSYLAPKELYERIYKTVRKVVYIDDYIRLDYPPGIIVNGTIGAENLPYKKDDEQEYLLGIEYMPLRKEFWDVDVPNRNGKIENILITFGAQDFLKLTPKILTFLLKQFTNYEYYVVGGKLPSDLINQVNVHYHDSVNADRMLELMLNSDIAVTAAGQTTYELARVCLQTIAIGVAENQKFNLKGWKASDFIYEEIWSEDYNLFEKVERNFVKMTNTKRKALVDGQGARRLINFCL
ncbi:MAG: UDP-2,4-diacetamido-2,4,6-trideoxy-beta-L-altropyranose hydrolase [Ignavibacteriae bacterium]|nr:UDP-2,4-diacetamido-2,4,6-trideoxy-beta-L-altropyranose hydrolase [Ignavibacteriota bacterium]|tara:strand:- start:209 stop:1150 length:942 start_codon:yes stop_codon:yes gene_type:complete